jgi:FMN-dependent NADH-azoreductase
MMAKVLYVQASPRAERSKSIQVADAFVKAYAAKHPSDKVETLNLFTAHLPTFDGLTINGKYNIMHGKTFSPEEKKAWEAVVKVIEHFKSFDKYVMAVPMWNFGIPYRLKQYLDIIIQPTYTFSVSDKGYEGLVKDKPVTVVYARGGSYPAGTPGEAYDLQKKYLELALGFIGFTNIQSILVDPTLHGTPEEVEKMIHEHKRQAVRQADSF